MSERRKVVITLVETEDGRRLLLQRGADSRYPNVWCIPGGKIEEGETSEKAAIRELVEETGLWDIRPEFVGEFDSKGRDDLTFLVFRFKVDAPRHVKIEPGFQGYGWFTQREADDLGAMEPASWI